MSTRAAAAGLARRLLSPGTLDRLRRTAVRLRVAIARPRIELAAVERNAAPSPYPFHASTSNPLAELGEKYAPTKRLHNYLVHYWTHFRDIRLDVRKVVEIGVQSDRSIRMWEEFFPNATIYGVDVDPRCKQYEGGRRRIFIGDQSDASFWSRVIGEVGADFDVVIDDGSHRVEHQIRSFNILFPALSRHGIYVVEDTGPVVEDADLRTVNELKGLVDHIMHWPDGVRPEDWPKVDTFGEGAAWADRNIVGIAFYRWIVFVMRGRNPEDNPFLARPSA